MPTYGSWRMFYTQTKSCEHENLLVLENHPKVVLWKWTMLRDHNICSGLVPYHGNIMFLEANDDSLDYYGS
jgi:hypothetical protein